MSRFDVVIIGSGISSLTCAALLARRGKSVCVLESHSKPGGFLHCFSRFGHRFDTGAHYLGAMGEGEPFRVLLEHLGVYDGDLFEELDPEGFDVLRFPGFELAFPQGYARVADRLSSLFPGEREGIREFLRSVRRAVRGFPTYEFNDASSDPSQTRRLMESLETPLSSVVSGLIRDPRLQCVLYSHCALHGVRPREISFGLHSIVMDSLIRGAVGFRHGGDGLARRYVGRIERSGGKVLTRKRVESLRVRGARIEEVITEGGERFSGEWVISGIHPKALFRMLSDRSPLTPAFEERLSRMRESFGFFGIYADADPEIPLDPRRNYYFFGTEDPTRLIGGRSQDPRLPASAVFASVPRRVPRPGGRGIPVAFHLASPIGLFEPWLASRHGRRPREYEELKRVVAGGAFELIEGYHPGFRGQLRSVATSSPLTNLHFNGSEEGSAYGIYHSIQNTGARALGPRTKILNLLLTGQSCLFPGLLGAAISGLRTSGHIVGIKPILSELRAGLGARPLDPFKECVP